MRGCVNGAVIFLMMLIASATFAADPIVVAKGGFADYTIDVPKGAAVIWRFSPQPIQRAKDLPPGRIIFGGEPGKKYTATAIIVDFDKKTVTDADYEFLFSGTPTDPDIPKDPTDPADPGPASYYFMLVRPDGPSSPEFTKIVGNPAWRTVEEKGNQVKDFTLSRARELGAITGSTPQLPCVVILKVVNKKATVKKIMSPIPDPIKLLEEIK